MKKEPQLTKQAIKDIDEARKEKGEKVIWETFVPKTVMEAVETLEEFLISDFGQKWSKKFLKTHFKICKKDIKRIQKDKDKKIADEYFKKSKKGKTIIKSKKKFLEEMEKW